MHSQSSDFGRSGFRLGREYSSMAMLLTLSAFDFGGCAWLFALSSKLATNALRLFPNTELFVAYRFWFCSVCM